MDLSKFSRDLTKVNLELDCSNMPPTPLTKSLGSSAKSIDEGRRTLPKNIQGQRFSPENKDIPQDRKKNISIN